MMSAAGTEPHAKNAFSTYLRVKQVIAAVLLEILHRIVWFIGLISIDDLRLYVPKGIFSPKYTISTGLMLKALVREARADDTVLDLGTGSGVLAIAAARRSSRVVATDVSPLAAVTTAVNARLNGVGGRVEVRVGHLFEPVPGERFSLMLFNPPYLSVCAYKRSPIRRAITDTPRLLLEFLRDAGHYLTPGGRVLIAYSTISPITTLLRGVVRFGWRLKVVDCVKTPFETVFVVRLTRAHKQLNRSFQGLPGCKYQ